MSPVSQSALYLRLFLPLIRRQSRAKLPQLAYVITIITLLSAAAPAQKRQSGSKAAVSGIAIPELRLQSVAVSPVKASEGKQASASSRLAQARVVPLEPDGHVATNVRFESFSVAAGGKPIAVRRVAAAVGADAHLSVALLLDVSGSMRGARIEAARKAIALFLGKMQPADRVALITFGKSAMLKQDFTTDKARVLRAIEQSRAVEDHTALYDALELTSRIGWDAAPGNRAIVLLSDGMDNASHFKADETVRLVEKRGVPVYTIALGDGANRATFARIATLSGGSSFVTDGTRGAGTLNDLYLEAWKHLAGGYIVEFSPPADARHIQITWKRQDGRNPSVEADLLHGTPLAAPALIAANKAAPQKSTKRMVLPLPLALGGAALLLVGAIGAGLLTRRGKRHPENRNEVGYASGQSTDSVRPLAELLEPQNLERPTVTDWAMNSPADATPTLVPAAAANSQQGGYRKGDTLVRPAPGSVSDIASAWLIVVDGRQKGQQFNLASEEVMIGRSREAQVRLDADEDVSRNHAKIRATPTGYILVDLASANGLFVNGARVYQHSLQDNDRITVGQSELVFKALNLGASAPVA